MGRLKGNKMSLLGVLGVVFVVLKLCEIGAVAAWSWWLVLLPFYGGLAIMLGIALVSAIVVIMAGGSSQSFKRKF